MERARAAEHEFLSSTFTAGEPLELKTFDVPIHDGMHIRTARVVPDPQIALTGHPPIVLVHGFTGALGFWKYQMLRLSRLGHTVYAVDLLGWGLSSRPRTFANFEWLQTRSKRKRAADARGCFVGGLLGWVKALQLGKLHLVGHSMGGWISAEFALLHPQHIAKLTLACSVGVYETDRSWFAGSAGCFMESTRAVFGVNWPFRLMRGLDALTCRLLRYDSWMALVASDYEDRKRALEYIRAYNLLPSSGEIIVEYVRRFSAESPLLWDRLHLMCFPVCLVYGEIDRTVPPFDQAILARLCNAPSVEVAVVRYGDHGCPTSFDSKTADTFASILHGTAGASTEGVALWLCNGAHSFSELEDSFSVC
jgi:pimeloyl-ACP methyl ester carboxylesterase